MRRIFFLLALVWCSVSYCGEYYYINESFATMNANQELDGEVISTPIYGTPVEIIDESPGYHNIWSYYYIKTPDGECGWTYNDGAIKTDKKYPSTPIVARVNTRWTFFYSEPNYKSSCDLFVFETALEVVSPEEDLKNQWIQIRDIEGDEYWVQSSDFVFNSEPLSLEEMLKKSMDFIGTPYMWGGTSSFGFDCSGFVQALFRLRGIDLPRFARQQAAMDEGIIVPFTDLAPGDLLFFGKEEIRHVGLYLGDDTFIHATIGEKSRPATIHLSSITDSAWMESFVLARRL